jgi:3-oxoadipate enol-lactonase
LETGAPLVFINSLGTDFRIWDNLIPHFAARFAIVRYDKRGHGWSDCPPGPYTIHDHAEDLAGLLAHLKIDRAILVGISVGGMIALDYTLHHPQAVGALVLCDTGAKIGTPAFWIERAEAIRKQGMESLADAIVGRWFTPAFARQHPAEYRGYYHMLLRAPVIGYVATCAALRDGDLRESVGKIEAKTLVLCGAEDMATPPDLARELAASLKNARCEIIDGAAHLPCIEQPDALAAKMTAFFRENGYGG